MTNRINLYRWILAFAAGCLLLAGPTALAATFTEGFDGATFPPTGWTATNASGTALNWRATSAATESNLTGGSGTAATVYSTGSPRTIYNCALVSPAIALPAGAASLALQFRTVLQTWSGDETADVDISIDSGATWTNLLRYKNVKSLNSLASASLAGYLGKTVKVRFRYYNPTTGAWDLYWQVDDVRIAAAGLVGDINGDGAVDMIDVLAMVNSWALSSGTPGFNSACDLNGDGTVDVVDLLTLVYNFGQTA